MKLYINGYKIWTVVAKKPGRTDKVYEFSNSYEALREYYERKATIFEWDDGSSSKLSHHVKYEWRVFYPSEIQSPDLMNYGDIENDEIAGYELFLTVHKDNSSRTFKVLIKDEKRVIDTESHFNGKDDTTNKGYEFAFINADSIVNVNMVNMNTYTEGIGGTHENPNKGAVQS